MNAQSRNLRTLVFSTFMKTDSKTLLDGQHRISSEEFLPVPHATDEDHHSMWQIRFEGLKTSTLTDLCLEINGEIILGAEDVKGEVINLLDYNKQIQGLSRRHLQISPTETDLWIVDLNSTNGTRKNGRLLQPDCPYALLDGDILELGDLLLVAHIVKLPHDHVSNSSNDTNTIHALANLSTAITSNLKLDDALQRIVQTTIDLCLADQLVILLWDEQSNELHLRAEHGLGKRKTGFITVPVKKNSPIFEVLQKGEPFRSNGLSDHKHEVVKGYFVNHAFYAPLTVGDVSNGILVAIRQNKENEFTLEEEQLLCAVARFAATAVFNSQKNETSHRQLERKVEELSTYNSISKVLAQTNNLTGIYGVLREHIRKHWHVENIGLWLVEEATDRLVPFPKPSFHKTYSIGEEMVGAVASSAVPVLASNIKLFSEPMKSVEPTLQLLARSAICVPVMEHNQVLGVLAAFSTRENEFGQQDVEWLQTLSQAASSAIRNAWLFEQVNNQRATIVAAVNMLPHPMMIVDQDGKISISNKAADAMLEEVHSTTNEKNCDFMPLYTLLNGLSESKWQTREIIIGEKVYVATLEYASMVGTVILMQDVTDPVTGVLSRRHFHDLAKQAFQQSKRYTNPLAALVIGLDDLGRMAAAHGYAIRNQILREFVSELRKSLRSPDILGRYQDDKFAVILPETTLENAMVVSERIIQSMSRKTITVENFRMACQVSIGAAMLDSDADDSVEVFLEKAHGALKLAENV